MNIHNSIDAYRLSHIYIGDLLQTSKEECHKVANAI